jgi:hypothetical protein
MDSPAAAPAGDAPPEAGFGPLQAVADAVLYEGYLLYPYRRSSPKNRVRWQFGVLAPRRWIEAQGPSVPGVAGSAESWYQQTECLLEAEPDAVLRLRLRYLQNQRKAVEERTGDGSYRPVESLETGGELHLTFDEAVPQEQDITLPVAELLSGERVFPVGAAGGERVTPLPGGAGRVVRLRRPVEARTVLRLEPLGDRPGTYRLRVRTENTGGLSVDAGREEALRHALLATHTLLGGSGIAYASLLDPPPWAEPHAARCRNHFTYPVLGGPEGARDLLLSSPILLPDHPAIAPESPGDLHDSGEIDEILSLRTALLTEDEKREARATDPRAAEIVDRCDTMSREVLARLHGAVRSLRPAADSPAPRATWWQEDVDAEVSPTSDRILIDGVPVGRGSRVRLRPQGRGSDAQDMFLAGRTAEVAAVLQDVDGGHQVAVTVDGDPAAELHGWYGRFHYFRPHEIQPLEAAGEEGRDGCRRPADT